MKTKAIFYAFIIFFFIAILIFVRNDYFLYKHTIVRVTNVMETQIPEKSTRLGTNNQQFKQKITSEILNGEFKGRMATYTNIRNYSGAFDKNIKRGDELFVTLDKNHNIRSADDFKRDFYISLITVILVLSLVILGQKKGMRTLITLILNIFIFCVILFLRKKGLNVLLLYIISSVIFIVTTLLIISGKNHKTLGAIVASILSLAVTMIIAFPVINIYKSSIHFEIMPFAIRLIDYQYVFYAGILISGLGAIMEIAITISSAIYELINKNPNITTKELRTSGAIIAADITGALINVLLFTFIVGTIPMITLAMANNIGIILALLYYANIEIIRFLVGAIGIVLTVPISLYTTIFISKRG